MRHWKGCSRLRLGILVALLCCISSAISAQNPCQFPPKSTTNDNILTADLADGQTSPMWVRLRWRWRSEQFGNCVAYDKNGNCVPVKEFYKVEDLSTCEASSEFTQAHKNKIKETENNGFVVALGQNISRTGEPSLKQNCHGATVGIQFWPGTAGLLLEAGGYSSDGATPLNASKAVHGNAGRHSSYGVSQGTQYGIGCDGQPTQTPSIQFTGKFGFGSHFMATEMSVNSIFNNSDITPITYYK